MRRFALALAISLSLSLVAAGVASASGKPDKLCPQSDFQPIALDTSWQPGDGVPDPGVDAWWDLTVAGFAAAGLTPADAAALYGFDSVEALYASVNGGILGVDKNGDGLVCWKGHPDQQNGQPPYFFNAIDNNARLH
jgi:hypothetical protein